MSIVAFYIKKKAQSIIVLLFGFALVNCSGSEDNSSDVINPTVYDSVHIGQQVWMQQNLNVSSYRDGTPIPEVTDPAVWERMNTGAWCYWKNDSTNGAIYGKLYNWYAVKGIYNVASLTNLSLRKQLAPIGWHVSTDAEWTILTNYLDPNITSVDFNPTAGGKIKEAGTAHWSNSNVDATNSSGFTALPGSCRFPDGIFHSSNGRQANWWTNTSAGLIDDDQIAYKRMVVNSNGKLVRIFENFTYGASVRCVRD